MFREFLAHNLAKSQYFSMKPSLFDYYYRITYYLHILAKYLKNEMWIIYYPKNLKKFTNQPYLRLRFLSNRGH